MKRARAGCKTRSVHNVNIPDDIWFEILTRVPVKSALRFRSVATPWRAMVDDPRFCRLHLTRFNHNRRESYLLAVQGIHLQWVVRFSQNLRPSRIRLRLPQTDKLYWITSSIDGLFMLRELPNQSNLVLWNPSTGNTRRLPPAPAVAPFGTIYLDMGLGFDPSVADYKFVRFFLLGLPSRDNQVEFNAVVYTVGTGSWKTLEFHGDRFVFSDPGRSFCLRGVLYSVAIDYTAGYYKLISFDLRTEGFASARLPTASPRSQALTLIDGGNSLALVDMSRPIGTVWVSDCIARGANNSFYWTLRHTFPTAFAGFENMPAVFFYLRKMDEDEFLFKAYNAIISYNVKTHKQKAVLKKDLQMDQTWPYMESLILHRG